MIKKVTVVVPVYADWFSLDICLRSLKEHLDSRHNVLVVNDCGPEADDLEARILKSIKECKNFSYHRNKKNLGFVKTCNRAVFELDKSQNDVLLLNSDTKVTEGFLEEMLEVLYASEKHGVTFPRSSNATLATIPIVSVSNRSGKDEFEYSRRLHDTIKNDLPQYVVTPTGVGFCLLIKRFLINNHGLFDEIYGLGYHEENDFCQRVNSYGYSVVMSNRAFVYHFESRSFSSEKKIELNKTNSKILLSRYPYYTSAVQRYFKRVIDPVDRFADILLSEKKPRLLINFFHFPAAFNGTTKNGHSLLEYIARNKITSKFDVFIFTQKESAAFHNLESYGFEILYPSTIGDQIFDIGYCLGQFFHYENLAFMNQHCVKNVFSMLDIIALRCQYLLSENYRLESIFRDSIVMADSVIAISQYTKEDMSDYFPDMKDIISKKVRVVREGYPGETFKNVHAEPGQEDRVELPKKYVLVFGNDFKHKSIERTIEAISTHKKINYVIVGPRSVKRLPENIMCFASGALSDRFMARLMLGSSAFLFPSQYEGFGFPIIEAELYEKPIAYFDSEVGQEIALLSKNKATIAFSEFANIPAIVEKLLKMKHQKSTSKLRSMDDYNKGVLDEIIRVQALPVNISELKYRWQYITRAEDYYSNSAVRRVDPFKLRAIKVLQTRSPRTYAALRKAYSRLR